MGLHFLIYTPVMVFDQLIEWSLNYMRGQMMSLYIFSLAHNA
jgi:hypothetical protein